MDDYVFEKALQKRKLFLQKTTVSYDTEIKADQFESEGTGIKMSFQATEQV